VLRFTGIWGNRMRLYIIGIMVGVIGFVVANQVRAQEGRAFRIGIASEIAGLHATKAGSGAAIVD
jgi:hypothetical protein